MKTIHVGSRLHLLSENIDFIKADVSYSHIYLADGKKILVSTHLLKLEKRFGNEMVRVHRSYLVNPKAKIEITEKEFTTPSGHKGLISRRMKKNLIFKL